MSTKVFFLHKTVKLNIFFNQSQFKIFHLWLTLDLPSAPKAPTGQTRSPAAQAVI